MKKFFVSIGLAATAAGLSSAFAQGMETASPKLWNISGTLRGFYDDNYMASHDKQGSWGFEVSPKVDANFDWTQTDFGFRYTFGMYYYFDRHDKGTRAIDYTHQADVWLDHAFDETLKLNVMDTFVVAQDPQLMDGGQVMRVSGNNIVNRGKASITKDWTRQFSTDLFYQNNLIIYSDSGSVDPLSGAAPSTAALLNRMEQTIGVDFAWQFQKPTKGWVGYNFSWVRFTDGGLIDTYGSRSGIRNNNAHYAYVGLSHDFSSNLSGSAKVGASVIDSYNNPTADTSVAPYADASMTYTFLPGSFLHAGFTQGMQATSVTGSILDASGRPNLTLYENSSTFYLNLSHQFDAKLTGSVLGQYSYNTFKGGYYGNRADQWVTAGINVNYQFNRYFGADAGYTFDELFSKVAGRDYSRNRVYVGLTATY